MRWFDKAIPVFVGSRTQLLALAIVGLRLAERFGGLPDGTSRAVEDVLVPLGAATLAAKIDRGRPT